jgi:hypothetical protein
MLKTEDGSGTDRDTLPSMPIEKSRVPGLLGKKPGPYRSSKVRPLFPGGIPTAFTPLVVAMLEKGASVGLSEMYCGITDSQ